jgi:hypothetical protein
MNPSTIMLAVSQFKMNSESVLKLVFNGREFNYDNDVLIECYDTCLCISSRLDDGKVHNVYVEYNFIAGVEVIE